MKKIIKENRETSTIEQAFLNTFNEFKREFINLDKIKEVDYNGYIFELLRDIKRARQTDTFINEEGKILVTFELVFSVKGGTDRFMKIYEINKNYVLDLSFLLNNSKDYKTNKIGVSGSVQRSCGGFTNNINLKSEHSDIIQSIKAKIRNQ